MVDSLQLQPCHLFIIDRDFQSKMMLLGVAKEAIPEIKDIAASVPQLDFAKLAGMFRKGNLILTYLTMQTNILVYTLGTYSLYYHFAEILQFIRNATTFDEVDLEEVIRHMADLKLTPLQALKDKSDLIEKLTILGVEKEPISIIMAPWQAQKLNPDFIVLTKIFRKGKYQTIFLEII